MRDMNFTFSDMIAGYVQDFDWDTDVVTIETSDGREYKVKLTETTYGEVLRNLGEAYMDCTDQLKDMMAKDRFLYAYGIFYPEQDSLNFEAKHIVFVGRSEGEYRFEKQDWWIQQVESLANFYLESEFGDGEIDYSKYRTTLGSEGEHEDTYRQETDTISRLVYGFASAYMMTGEDHFLEAAEKGTKYLHDHFRNADNSEDMVYWYHGIDIKGNKERKVFASEFGDDYDALPAYEQIYALAGPTQTYRITGNTKIMDNINKTLNLFEKYYLDRKQEGYYTHIDPITFSPKSESLGRNRARKNWNSNGDHAPAYLINAWLATENDRFKEMLEYTANIITEHFQDYDNSPFVQERFHEDWSKDQSWGWQQNRAVVGHNLKIAWNLMRIHNLIDSDEYVEFAEKIAEVMPEVGSDQQRGGWYDVVERELEDDQKYHRFAWHNRKAWWQQEQAILAYLILAGVQKEDEYLKLARESASFYNAWFLDHDAGGVYFNVLADGLPYMMGTERKKGSHSMSGYHSFELTYLAAVYTNLLITKEPLDLYFKPYPNGFPDDVLRVQPDILPDNSVKIEKVWVEGDEYTDFDAEELKINLPDTNERVEIKVRLVPTSGVEHFSLEIEEKEEYVKGVFTGDFDARALKTFKNDFSEIIEQEPANLALIFDQLDKISIEGLRGIVFECQKLPLETDIYLVGVKDELKEKFDAEEFSEAVEYLDEFDEDEICS